jgi:phytoene dehydrogenase-like protein
MRETEVAIIGAGCAGLACASLLAQKGVRTEVFESLKVPGGRARCTERDGFVLDHGVHSHRLPDECSAARVMQGIGETVDWVQGHDERPEIICNGEKFVFPQSVMEFLKLPFLDAGDRLRLLFLLGRIKFGNPSKHIRTSFADYVGPGVKRPKFRALMKVLSFAVMAPDIECASAGEVVELLQRAMGAERGVSTPRGGEGQLIKKMVKRITDPARLNLGEGVKRIHIRDGRVEAVETGLGMCKARAVLFTIPVQKLFKFVDPSHFRPEFRSYAQSLTPTSGISVDLALSAPVSDLGRGFLDLSSQLIGKFPSVVDPSLAPPKRQLATWLWVLDQDRMRDKQFLRAARAIMRSEIEKLVPGIMKAVMWERWLFFPIMDGAILKVGQAWQDRHPLQSEDISNLFFAGDTARAPGVGGEIAFESALWVAPLIEKFLAEKRA